MKHENHIEAQNAQTKISRKLTEQGEISTLTDTMQVDNQTTTVQQNTPVINTKKPDGKENYYFNNSEISESDSFDSNFITQDALIEDQLDLSEPDEPVLRDEFEQTAVEKQDDEELFKELAGKTARAYVLRAQKLFDCEDSQALNLAAETILQVNYNHKANWLLIGIAAYRVQLNTVPLPGGARKSDDLEVGRKKAIEKLAKDCAGKGMQISFSTLYDYARWVRVLLEEPLEKYRNDKETVRRQRTVLMKKYFEMPPGIAKTVSTGSDTAIKLKLASQLEKEKGAAITNKELKTALSNYFKNNASDKNAAGDNTDRNEAGSDSGSNANGNSFEVENQSDMAFRPDDDQETESNLSFDETFVSHTYSEAKRTKIEPEKVKDLYVSFLQMMLSTVKNMGVKK